MDIKNFAERYMPQEVNEAVGSDKAEVAIKMASTAAAFGLKPVNLIGGRVYAGSTRQLVET